MPFFFKGSLHRIRNLCVLIETHRTEKIVMKNLYKTALSIVLLNVVAAEGYSQSLDLFQANEDVEEREEGVRRPQREQQSSINPAFTLVGTSRFGEKYLVSLLARNGTSVVVEWKPGELQEIKGHLNYSVANVSGRSASLRYPESDPCVANDTKGVQCIGGLAVLSLNNATPIEAPVEINTSDKTESVVEEMVASNEAGGDDNASVTRFRNPFTGELQEVPQLTPEEQAERDARRQERAAQFRNFEIVRIPDDEIPQGMQRVRTPFGDSLEPIEE